MSEELQFTQEEALAVAQACYDDPVLFCKTFLPDLFPPPPGGGEPVFPWFQRGLLAILTGKVDFLDKYGEVDKIISNFVVIEEEYNPLTTETTVRVKDEIFSRTPDGRLQMKLGQHVLFICPRGFSKTTIAGIAVPLYNTIYMEVQFTLYVSHAEDHAVMQLDNAKRQLETNQRLLAVFGNLKPARTDVERWSARFYETKNGCAAAARGAGGQVRGLLHNGHRPQVVLVDDLEDIEDSRSETVRKSIRAWFMSDLKPVLPKVDEAGRMVVLGTITHPDCLLEHLKKDPQWSTVQMGVYDRQGELLWPRNMDKRKLESEEASFAAMGELPRFYMEYHSRIMTPESQLFKQEYFQYGIPEERIVAMTLAMDPAISERRTADYTAIALVGFTVMGSTIVLDCWMERTSSESKKLDAFFSMARTWNMPAYAHRAGIESTGFQAGHINSARQRMFQEQFFFELEPITGKGNKIARIKSAVYPRHRARNIWFAKKFSLLEQQLVLFREDGSHEHDDGPDVLAMCLNLGSDYLGLSAPFIEEGKVDSTLIPLEDLLDGGYRWAS